MKPLTGTCSTVLKSTVDLFFGFAREQNIFGESVGKYISWNSRLPEKDPAVGLFRYPFNSLHYSIFCSQYWNVPNNMLLKGN